MRGLWKAVLCLAAVVASASPESDFNNYDAISSEIVVVKPKFHSHYTVPTTDLFFRVDVSGFHDACGYTDIRINGQSLPAQYVSPAGGRTPGYGFITLSDKRVVKASWSLQCINSGNVPEHILLEFNINAVDGVPIDRSRFELAFSQTDHVQFLSKAVYDAGDSNLSPPVPGSNLENTRAELQWLRDQIKLLKSAIREKELVLSEHGVAECDNFKCVAQISFSKASNAAHTIINKITGYQDRGQSRNDTAIASEPFEYECTDEQWHNNSHRLFKYLLILNIFIVGIPFIVILALLLRCYTYRTAGFKDWRQARQARREARREARQEARRERRERCLSRRAAFQAALSKLSSHFSRTSEEKDEEKEATLLSDAEDGMSTTMTDEISQFQNVVSIVDDIVHAEQTRTLSQTPLSMPPESTYPVSIPGRRHYYSIDEIRSEVDDEELPAYASYDEHHVIYPAHIAEPGGSVISDGFQYSSSPGSSIYTPSSGSSSETSSIVEVVGPDTKQ